MGDGSLETQEEFRWLLDGGRERTNAPGRASGEAKEEGLQRDGGTGQRGRELVCRKGEEEPPLSLGEMFFLSLIPGFREVDSSKVHWK